jgi:small subunit ribosomal protein S17
MADETPETEETTPEATADAPAPEAAAEQAPAQEAAPEEAAADEPVADELEAAAEPEPAAEPAPAAEPEPVLHPKVRRGQARSRHAGEANTPKTIEERAAARKEARRAKAVARTRRRGQEREKARALRAENPATPTPPREHGPGAPKLRLGIVVSDTADKTITVRIDSARQHRRYKKIVRRSNTLHAHDEANSAHVGDRVQVIESRPLSATKRWRLVDILERAK